MVYSTMYVYVQCKPHIMDAALYGQPCIMDNDPRPKFSFVDFKYICIGYNGQDPTC